MASWTDHVVEIRIPVANRVGSGFVIGPGLILTALHVIVGPLDNCLEIVAPARILIRAYGDFLDAFRHLLQWSPVASLQAIAAAAVDGDFRWRDATLVWPPSKTPPP